MTVWVWVCVSVYKEAFSTKWLFCFILLAFVRSFVDVFNNRGNIVILFLLQSVCLLCMCVCVYECRFPENENGGPSSVSLVKRRASIRRDDLYFVVAACFFFS